MYGLSYVFSKPKKVHPCSTRHNSIKWKMQESTTVITTSTCKSAYMQLKGLHHLVNCFNSIQKFNRRSKEVQTHQQNWWNHWFISDMSEESDDEGTLVVHKPRYGSLGMKACVNVLCQVFTLVNTSKELLGRHFLQDNHLFYIYVCIYIVCA